MKKTADYRYRWLILLAIFTGMVLFTGLGKARLIDWDENIYAEASRQMLKRGDYLNVVINDHPFAEKPPFFFWEQVIAYRLFGVNEFAARFPSAMAGLLMVFLLYYLGKRIESPRTGLLWGLVYLTALLPSCLARAAVIDFTFNLFITTAAYFLYLFDVEHRRALLRKNRSRNKRFPPRHLVDLTIASVAMGLAVLTKGPLGGVIPLIGFAGYKVFYRKPAFGWGYFLYCATLSMTIGFSWYVINSWLHGGGFVRGFWAFQLALFSRSLEGHEGPMYYHLIIVLLGLAPWTPFLFLLRPGIRPSENAHFRPLFFLGTAWTVFVLVLMSLVSTKLPHYSASVYVPLAFMVAIVLRRCLRLNIAPTRWVSVAVVLLTVGLAVLVWMIPLLAEHYVQQQNVDFNFDWSPAISVSAGLLVVLGIAAGVLAATKRIRLGIAALALYMLVFTQSLWHLLVPPFLSYNQDPLIEMVQTSQRQGGKVVFYRLVSFAALFYGQQTIEMLHTYKFPGNPAILNQRHDQDLYVFTDKRHKDRLLAEHPLVRHLQDRGTFSWFILDRVAAVRSTSSTH
jgi:4-amino-4-deoxy-L-arabinose transferase-like glycosyltransferase